MAISKEKRLKLEEEKTRKDLMNKKKKMLKEMIVNSNYIEPVLFGLMRFDFIDFIIEKISFDTLEENSIKAENYIELLKYFTERFRHYFFSVGDVEYIIRKIIISNPERIEEYLRIEDPVDIFHKNKIADYKIYQLIISNFIHNSKHIPYIETLLKEHRINLKEVDNYSYDECYKIVLLLSNIVFCQRNRGIIDYLFESIDFELESRLEELKQRRNRHYKEEQGLKLKNKIFNNFVKEYELLFKRYNERKPYLKYFRIR